MNTWPRRLLFILLVVLSTFSAVVVSGAAQVADSDSGQVGLNVIGADETATAAVTPMATSTSAVTATATDEAGLSSNVPFVAQLPETGVVGSQSSASFTLVAVTLAGSVLVLGALAGHRRSDS